MLKKWKITWLIKMIKDKNLAILFCLIVGLFLRSRRRDLLRDQRVMCPEFSYLGISLIELWGQRCNVNTCDSGIRKFKEISRSDNLNRCHDKRLIQKCWQKILQSVHLKQGKQLCLVHHTPDNRLRHQIQNFKRLYLNHTLLLVPQVALIARPKP